MNGRSQYFLDGFRVCGDLGTGGDVDVCLDLDFRDFEYREGLEGRDGLGVVAGVGLGVELGGSFDDIEGSSCVDSKGDSTVLDGQSIWGLMRSSQGIPKMIE